MSGHKPWTPGPWVVYTPGCTYPGIEAPEAGESIVIWGEADEECGVRGDQAMANARLISAAPELVEALERLCDFNPPPVRCEEYGDYLRAEAIRNAEALLAKIYGTDK